jgi:outer membrane protein assembly factor BamB
MTRLFILFALSLALSFSLARAGDWPRFRGPNGAGVADGELPTPDTAHQLWKVRIPGRGVSSPVVAHGKVFLQSATDDGTKRLMICLDAASGKSVWTTEVPGRPVGPKGHHVKNSMASSTPAVDAERVFGVFWDGIGVSLHAFDLAGQPVWNRLLGEYVSQHGPGLSPAVYNGLVYVNVDDDKRAELIAFDAKTGEKRWSAPRQPHRASYSTPFLLERPGKPAELLLGTTTAVTAYEPATGKVVWSFETPWPSGRKLRVVGSPIAADGLVVVPHGDGDGSRYMIAVDPNSTTPAKAWDLAKGTPYVPILLTKGDLLFWISDGATPGLACCAEAKTGKVLWSERVLNSDVTSSPLLIGDRMLAIGENGELAVVKADREFERVYAGKLGEGVSASPAFADGKLYIRGTSHLFCFGKK